LTARREQIDHFHQIFVGLPNGRVHDVCPAGGVVGAGADVDAAACAACAAAILLKSGASKILALRMMS
jgi:hypothetical protein